MCREICRNLTLYFPWSSGSEFAKSVYMVTWWNITTVNNKNRLFGNRELIDNLDKNYFSGSGDKNLMRFKKAWKQRGENELTDSLTTKWIDNSFKEFCCKMELRSAGGGCRLWKFYFYYDFLRWEELTACSYTSGNDTVEGKFDVTGGRGQSWDDVLKEGRRWEWVSTEKNVYNMSTSVS